MEEETIKVGDALADLDTNLEELLLNFKKKTVPILRSLLEPVVIDLFEKTKETNEIINLLQNIHNDILDVLGAKRLFHIEELRCYKDPNNEVIKVVRKNEPTLLVSTKKVIIKQENTKLNWETEGKYIFNELKNQRANKIDPLIKKINDLLYKMK